MAIFESSRRTPDEPAGVTPRQLRAGEPLRASHLVAPSIPPGASAAEIRQIFRDARAANAPLITAARTARRAG